MDFRRDERAVMEELQETLGRIDAEQVNAAIKMIEDSRKVFFVGVGRVRLALEAIAKRFAHLGIDAVVVGEITEPAITDQDLLIVGSGSGETGVPLFIAGKAKEYGARVLHIGTKEACSMEKYRDCFVKIPAAGKKNTEGVQSIQPMTSLFEQSLLLVGDIMAYMMIKEHQIDMPGLWQCHANLE